jgi:hypothetical protein
MPKSPISSIPQPPLAKKGTYVASGSNQQPANQLADDKKKGAADKKLHISTGLEAK